METPDQERTFLAAAVRGEHIAPELSLFPNGPKAQRAPCDHYDRAIVCVDDKDVVECVHCGRQRVTRCTFDDDYA